MFTACSGLNFATRHSRKLCLKSVELIHLEPKANDQRTVSSAAKMEMENCGFIAMHARHLRMQSSILVSTDSSDPKGHCLPACLPACLAN